MNFKVGDVIRANRSGLRARIVKADPVAECYAYEYIDQPVGNFKGLHSHKISEMEPYWSLISESVFPQENNQTSSCDHQLQEYVGIREVYKYCTKCDYKLYG